METEIKYFWMADNSMWSASSLPELVERMRVSSRAPGDGDFAYMEGLSQRAWLYSEIKIRCCCPQHFITDLLSNQLLHRSQ